MRKHTIRLIATTELFKIVPVPMIDRISPCQLSGRLGQLNIMYLVMTLSGVQVLALWAVIVLGVLTAL